MYQKLYHNLKSSQSYALFVVMNVLFVLILLTGCDSPGKSATSSNSSSSKQQPTTVPSSPQTPLGSGTALGPLYMVNSQVGWSRSDKDMRHIFRTVDGGKSWQQIKLPQELSSANFWAYVFDADMALLQPFQVKRTTTPPQYFYRTVDGGVTWQRCNWPSMPIEAQSGSLSIRWTFLDHMHGWVMTLSPSSLQGGGRRSSPSENQMLFQTDNGGQTWQLVARLPLKYNASGLSFIDAHTGWLVTSADKPGHTSPSDPQAFPDVLYVTHDGGHTWKQSPDLPLPVHVAPLNFSLGSPAFFNQREGYLKALLGKTGYDEKTYIYTTQDGGNTWQVKGAALPVGGGVRVVDATHFSDVAFLYALVNGQWVKTSNPVPVSRENAPVVDFASPQVGLASTHVTIDANKTDSYQTVLYRTDDGGKLWKKIGILPEG